MGERNGGRVVFVGHSSVLSGAELGLIDMAVRMPGCLVCLFEDGPLVGAMRDRGVDVRVLGDAGGALQVRRDGGFKAALQAVPGVLRLVVRLARHTQPADLLYGNSQKAWVICALTAAVTRRRTLWHLHDIVTAEHFSRVMARAGVLLANLFADSVIVNSQATGDSVTAQGGRAGLLRVVYNGVDPAPFEAAAFLDRNALRRKLGLRESAMIVGLFGRITPWKGQHVLLEALRSLPDVEAVFVGGPLFGEQDYQAALEREAALPALAGRVRFLGFRRDIAEVMRAVDLVVHASTSPEPFGRVIVEAMMSRRPVIATRAGGVPEIIEDGVDGLLVAPGDAAAMADAIRQLCADPPLAARVAEAGYSKAHVAFTVERMMDGLRREVAEATGGRAA